MAKFSSVQLQWNNLGVKIIVLALLITVLASFFTTGFQLMLTWQSVQDEKTKTLTSIESLYLPMISKAYWDYDLEQVESLMNIVEQQQFVGQVVLIGHFDETYTSGFEIPENHQEKYEFDVRGDTEYISNQELSDANSLASETKTLDTYLGKIGVILDQREIHEALYSSLLNAIPVLFLLLFVFSSACLIGIILVVSRPIRYLTKAVEAPDQFQLSEVIRNPFARKWADSIEIEGLFNSINKMRFSIHKQMTQKSLLQKKLGRYVKLLHLSNNQLKAVFDSIGDAVVVTDHQFIVEYANQNAMNVPLAQGAFRKGESFFQLLYANADKEELEGRWDQRLLNEMTDVFRVDVALAMKGEHSEESSLQYFTLSCASFTGADEFKSYVFLFTDVSEHKKMFQKIEYLATHDYLTGALNRFSFENKIQKYIKSRSDQQIQHTGHSKVQAVLLYINIDHFRVVNDSVGRIAGDELLKQIGRLLSTNIEGDDFLARLEGDVFAYVGTMDSKVDAHKKATDIYECISGYTFYWGSRKFRISISVGAVLLPSNASSIDSLLQFADGCSKANTGDGGNLEFFEDLQSHYVGQKHEVRGLMMLEEALQAKTLKLFLQPIVPIEAFNDEWTEEHHGVNEAHEPHDLQLSDFKIFELLVRIQEPNGSLIYPAEFLPSAEYYKKITLVDRYVIDRLFEFIVKNLSWFATVSHISVNLSGQSLTEEFMLGYVVPQVDRYGFSPHKLCFEVTETVAIANLQSTNAIITQMKKKGFQFSLDDFGSGLASYGYLQQLPVDYLKIDGSFVQKICDSQVDLKLVESMNSVAHHIGLKTIAEYVENQAILEKVTELCVDFAQGHYYGRAIPIEDYAEGFP